MRTECLRWLVIWGISCLGWAHATALPAGQEDLLTLTLERVVATYPSVQAARASRIGSDAGYDAARWQYYPSPSINTERGTSDSASTVGNTTSTTLRLQQNLWAGGRIDASVNAAKHRAQLGRIAIAQEKTTMATRVLDTWLTLLTNFGGRQAAQQGLDRLQSLSDMMDRRVERNVSASIDAVLMRSRLTQMQSELQTYASAQAGAAQRLIDWAGEPDLQRGLSDDVLLTKILRSKAEELPASTPTSILNALDTQPALRRNQAEIAVAQEEVLQKKGEAWPNVYVRVDRQFNDSDGGRVEVRSADTMVYLGLQYNPGAGLSLASSIRAAQSKVLALQQDREAIRQDLQDRASTEWRNHLTITSRLHQATEAVQSANQILQAYTRLFVVGRRSWLEVLNAARELFMAEQSLHTLQAQQVVGAYRLRILKGEFGWQNDNESGYSPLER